jgi:hypothetical protein
LQKASKGRCYINGSSGDQEREDGVYKKINRNNVGMIMPDHILRGSWHKNNLSLYIIKKNKRERKRRSRRMTQGFSNLLI